VQGFDNGLERRGNTLYYVLDADPKEDPNLLLEANRDSPLAGQREVFQTQSLTVEQAPSATSWGVGIRAYAPIHNRWPSQTVTRATV
jgi:hypothetical protein